MIIFVGNSNKIDSAVFFSRAQPMLFLSVVAIPEAQGLEGLGPAVIKN